MKQIPKLIFFGFLSWLIPFIISFFFFKDGSLTISEIYFKTIMVVTGALSAVILLVLFFQKITNKFLLTGIIVGFIWLAINWFLDLLMVWRGFFDMTYIEYFQEIGLRYLSIPIYSIGVGYMLNKFENKKEIEKE